MSSCPPKALADPGRHFHIVRRMAGPSSIAVKRAQLLESLFPEGVPALWCPSLTHYDRHGAMDAARIAAHLRHLSPHVNGFLIPGSTSDGWELNDSEFWQLLEIALDQARQQSFHLLIGVLKADARDVPGAVAAILERLKSRAKATDSHQALRQARVSGFAVCPPRGKDVTQAEMSDALASVLDTGLPIALYQLPQVTQNEISPEVVSRLARRLENLILFKDSSGTDRVASSREPLDGVFTMRGAEGDYARWLKPAGGLYDGFLLSTANCFAPELRRLIAELSNGQMDSARQISDRLTAVIKEMFALISNLPQGNPYANANKAMDHFFAWGPRAAEAPPPRLHSGGCLPVEVLRGTKEILSRHGLLPETGYL